MWWEPPGGNFGSFSGFIARSLFCLEGSFFFFNWKGVQHSFSKHLELEEEKKPSELDMRWQILVKESKDSAPPLIKTPANSFCWLLFAGAAACVEDFAV